MFNTLDLENADIKEVSVKVKKVAKMKGNR